MTRQRKIILDALENVESHLTADQVYEIVRQRLPRISLGTVYRNLEVLSNSGMIKKLEFGGSQKRFDSDLSDHYHVRCTKCGRVDDVEADAWMTVADFPRSDNGYDVVGHRLEFIGICPACKQSKPASQKTGH
jgi:Fur family ferric uptake transcriptional regulator